MEKYRFGDFELDLDALQLRCAGVPVRLERRPLDLLVLLVQNHGRMVSREEIIAALWPKDVIIDFDSGLNTLVRKVRNALGDSAEEPHFLETVPGRGYRFVASVTATGQSDAPAAGQVATPVATHRRFAPLAVTALALVTVGVATWMRQRDNAADEVTRIAVLPFENLTGSDEYDYLAQGLAEDTSTSFGQIDLPGLRVIGGISARAFVKAGLPVQQADSRLGIDYIVESSLRADGSRIRVTSRLIHVPDGEQLWSATFDRELTGVLGMQRELSVAIAEQVRQRLSPEVAAAIDRRQTRNPAAYELYLKGRYQWSRLLPHSFQQALDYYQQAADLDPDYALAWAGIAHALSTSTIAADAETKSVAVRARTALDHALAADPDLAETQFARCIYNFALEWNITEAEEACRRAVALDPNSGLTHMVLAFVLIQQGNLGEAVAISRRSRELEPLFPLIFANSAVIARAAGDYQSSIELAKQAIAIAPGFWVGHFQLAVSYLAVGDETDALEAFTQADNYSSGHTSAVAGRAYVLARLGQEAEARRILADLEQRARQGYVPPYAFAYVYAGLGEDDKVFEWLDRALEVHDVHMLGLKNVSVFTRLHSDPRFQSLLARRGMR